MSRKLGLAFVLALALPMVASAQPIPAGVSAIDGFYSVSEQGPLCSGGQPFDQVSGYLINPGPGKLGTEVQLNFNYFDGSYSGQGIVMVVSSFPAQPSTGLNGWGPLAIQNQYLNGKLVSSNKMYVNFALTPITSRTSQGTIVMDYGSCPQTVQLILTHGGQ